MTLRNFKKDVLKKIFLRCFSKISSVNLMCLWFKQLDVPSKLPVKFLAGKISSFYTRHGKDYQASLLRERYQFLKNVYNWLIRSVGKTSSVYNNYQSKMVTPCTQVLSNSLDGLWYCSISRSFSQSCDF